MIWDENMIKYAHDRICAKYQPRECNKCPLERFNGCKVGIIINEIKAWSKDNIPEQRLLAKRGIE